MLTRKDEILTLAAQIEVAIAPGVELSGAAPRMACAAATATRLSVVDDEHSEAMASLQLAQVAEQRADFAAGILVDAVKPHEGIEDEQAWLEVGDGIGEVAPIGLEIEPERGGGDDLDIDIREVDAGGGRDALEPPAHSGRGVLGGIEEDTAGVGHDIAAETGNTRSNGDGQLERQERLAALGLAADDADRFMRPQIGDKPAQFCGRSGEAPGGFDG